MQLGRWKAAIQDCEMLIQEIPEDEEVKRVFLQAKSRLQKTC